MLSRETELSVRQVPEPKKISPQDVGRLLKKLEERGLIKPITPKNQRDWQKLREWGEKEELPPAKVADFLREKLTPKGERLLEKQAKKEGLDLQKPLNFLDSLSIISSPDKISKENRIDKSLEKALRTGPSSFIADAIGEQLAAATQRTTGDKIPLQAWLLNPKAAIRRLKALIEEASANADLKREVSRTARQLAEVARDDSKRDILLSYAESLEEALSPYLEPYCHQHGIPVPPVGTLERIALLLKINAEMAALQRKGREITKEGEKLVEEQVKLQSETAKDQMLTRELPKKIEAEKEANTLREASKVEQARHRFAYLTGTLIGGVVGLVGGIYSGIERSVATLVEKHPKVAISLGAGTGFFVYQITAFSGQLSGEVLQAFALKSALVAGVAALGTGIGAGLAARFYSQDQQQESS